MVYYVNKQKVFTMKKIKLLVITSITLPLLLSSFSAISQKQSLNITVEGENTQKDIQKYRRLQALEIDEKTEDKIEKQTQTDNETDKKENKLKN